MHWKHSGEHASVLSPEFAAFVPGSGDELAGTPFELDGQKYQIRQQYLVPYVHVNETGNADAEQSARERLNMELCDRVFRLSDARDVRRSGAKADQAIDALMQAYEKEDGKDHRGTGRILFARIVARIRDLSAQFLEEKGVHDQQITPEAQRLLDRIGELYRYVMIDHRDIFACVRLYDHSVDHDGIIEETFSEIGKTQRVPIETIYANRVDKIGHAMKGIDTVSQSVAQVLNTIPSLPLDEMKTSVARFGRAARRLVGVPSSDHVAYDQLAAEYVNAHDAARNAVSRLDHMNVLRGESHVLADWLRDGLNLIHSMQNLRDGRDNSVDSFQQAAKRWTERGRGVG